MASVSEASIISRLDKSDYRNLRQDFLQYLKPLSNLVTFNYDHDSTNNNNNVKNQKTIRQLANKFLQFLNRALKYLPIRLNELQKSDRETALDLFCMYKVCLACSKFLSPYLENKPFQVHVQSLYLVLSYEAWGMYVDAEVESFRILESLRSVYYSPKIEQDTSCLLPDVNLHEDPGLASLIVKVVQTIVSCAFKSLRKEDAVYKRVLSLVHQARPWFRLLDSKTFDILHYSLVTNLYSCTVRILEEDACLDGDLVDLFCMTTITEHLKSSANNHLLVRASNICLTIISQQRSRSSLIVHILTCVLDFIACDCKVGVKFTVNECLDVVHNIVKKCRCASTDSCRYVGQNLVEIASNFREVSPPFSSILELYAAGLCYTENSLQPSCIGSEGLLSESLITLPIRGGDDLLYLNDVLRSLADYFHGGSNSCVSCECSVSCKHEHGRVSFLSYLKALAFFCHPFAELVTSASNTLLPEKKFPTFSPNLTIILDAFQQYSDACHSHFSCRSEREMGNFDYTQGKLHLVVIAALIVSLWTNKNVKKSMDHIELVMSSWWIQLNDAIYISVFLSNIGAEFYNRKQMKEASDMLNICCRSAWTCINNLEARSEALSEEAISHYVTKTCSRSGTLLLALHECGSTDLIEVVITTLSNCSTVANLFENLDGPTNLMRQWVKFVCKDYKDADTCDNAPLVYPRLSKYLKEKNFSTTITMRTTRIILEQELLAYEQMEENYINLCQTMQLKITEILLGEVYVRNDLQRSKVLIKKGRLLRACGIGDLECCIGCLSEAISILSVNQLDVSVESTSNCSQVSDLLAVAYCLRALCTQEVPQPNSKVILEDIQSAVELWMSIDRYENFNRELATDYKIPLLCCVADLLSVKGHFQLQSDIYTLIIVLLKRKGVPVQKCFAMLWTDRRLSHALCTKSIDEDAILCLAKHFGTCFDPNSIGTWVTCLKDSQPLLLVGFRQKFSLYDSILTQHGHFPPGSCLGSNVTVGEVKEVASTLNSNVHKTTSNFLLGYLYHDLCERLISSGQLVEALLFAKKALHLRSLLLRDKFVCRFWTAPLKTIDYNHAEVEVLGSVATEVWPNGRLWNIEQCNLSQWSVLRCYLESILQVGVIHEALGNASLAEFLFLRGKKISFEEELPIFRVAFASALGDIYCKKQLWDLAKTELTRGREILVNSSTSLISCKLCKLTLGVTIDHRFGDLARKHSDGTGTSLLNKTSNALGLYKKALKKLKLFAWNLESEPNVRMTRSRSRTSYNRNMKFPNEVESKCLKVSSENSIFGCPSSHCWMEPNMPSRTEVGSTEMTVCNRKNCWKCLLQKVMETENTKDFISMKCEFHRRRLCLRLLTAIGICVGESGKVYEMHEIFWQCIMMLFDQRTFCETFSGSHSLFLEVIGNKWQCDLFATERAAILYNLSWFSLKNIHSGNTCCDLSRIQLPSIISWLLQAFILSREIPLYFQKVSKLLATVFLLSTSTERFHLPLYPGNTLCGCHWAAFFHQASLGTYFNQQLCDPNVLKLVKPVDFEGTHCTAPSETSTEVFNMLRCAPGRIDDLEKFVIDFFRLLPSTTVICISLLGADYAGLFMDVLPGHFSSSAWILLSRLNSDNEPLTMLLPSDVIPEYGNHDKNCSTLYEGTDSKNMWFCPWGGTTVDDIAPGFKRILQESYLSSSFLAHTQHEKSLWWTWRRKLNDRLDNFLRSLEQSWLGPWKCLLLGELLHSTCLDTALIKMTTFLKCNFELNANQNLLRVILGGSSCISEIEECICQMLVPKCCITRSESCPNKKLNISSFTCAQAKSLSGFLHQLISEATYKLEAECIERRPVIMVLDSDVQMLPWENLPVLRKEEVYRMPSVGSISALINLTFYYQGQFGGHDATFPSIDPLDAFYLLHPTDNSNCRKGEFEDWLRDKKLKGKAETSSVEELVLALKSHDLFLYFGHGNGTQFLPKDEIEKISSCAATLLMGCSSGSLPFVGCYNPHGIVLSYLLAGSPAIIANLWEVTDKDIERFGKTVLSACLKERSTLSHECRTLVDELESVSIGSSEVSATRIASKGTKLRNDNINSRCKETTGRRSSIASFMSQAREACVFPFLIGASPVCYGVPTGIRKKDL